MLQQARAYSRASASKRASSRASASKRASVSKGCITVFNTTA